jgi:hypothetical protein
MNSPLPFVPRAAKARGMARRHSSRHPLFHQRWFADDIIITCMRWYLRFKRARRATAHSHSRCPGAYCYPQLSPFPDSGSSDARLPRSAKVGLSGLSLSEPSALVLCELHFVPEPKISSNLRLLFANR